MKSILIVGAGGFIGGFIAQKALEKEMDTYVGIRSTTSRRYLTDERLHFIEFDYEEPTKLVGELKENAPEGGWDYIIYNLGATKATNFLDFNRINYTFLQNFVKSLITAELVPERFLYMSSLSALGPGDEQNYTPLTSKTIPSPNTRYGVSKLKAETFLQTLPDFPWIIFRPTGVYGPHEKDYLMMIKSIDNHFDFGVGYKKQLLTFIYVEDLVDAMFMALEAPKEKVLKNKYIISEEKCYTQKEFRNITAELLGKKMVIPLKLPMGVVYAASVVAEKWGLLTMKPSTLNRDKFRIMRQRNWAADVSDAQRDFGFKTRFDLRRGLEETIKAYRKEKEAQKTKKK